MKIILNLKGFKVLKKEEQKKIVAGRHAALTHEDGLDIYCHCSEGGGWHVGTAHNSSDVINFINQCEADGGTPSTYNPG